MKNEHWTDVFNQQVFKQLKFGELIAFTFGIQLVIGFIERLMIG